VTVLQSQSWRLCSRPCRRSPPPSPAGVVSPQVAGTPRDTDEPKAMDFALLARFRQPVCRGYGLVFTLPDDLRAIYLKLGIDLARG